MEIDTKKWLYSFSINVEKEVEEQVEKKTKRKNKETGKIETVTSQETVTVKKEVPFTVLVRRPTRSQLEDGDMFYSLELNKFIKMGMLTKAMLAKQYGNQGGLWTEKEQQLYKDLMYKMHLKQLDIQQLSILSDNGKLSTRQKNKLNVYIRELADIKKELTEYEMIQNSLFDHTADVKARNRTIMWYILHTSHFFEGDAEEPVIEEMFEGTSFEERWESYQDKEESEDEIYMRCIDKISSILTVWYISGIQETEGIEEFMDEMKKQQDDDIEVLDFGVSDEEEEEIEIQDSSASVQKKSSTKKSKTSSKKVVEDEKS
jgi:hypothetical protein